MSQSNSPIRCPICNQSTDELDFHHWNYEQEIGVEIFRECHNYIHNGQDGRVAVQQNRVEYWGGDHWHEIAVVELVDLDLMFTDGQNLPFHEGEVFDHQIPEHRERYYEIRNDIWQQYVSRLEDQYNLPGREDRGISLENPIGNWDEYFIGRWRRALGGASGPSRIRGLRRREIRKRTYPDDDAPGPATEGGPPD